jgi:FXSXX-COOH protein
MDDTTNDEHPAGGRAGRLVDVTTVPLSDLLGGDDSVLSWSLDRLLRERESHEEVVAGHSSNLI